MKPYLVPGISCDSCKTAIEHALGELAEVTGVEVDVKTKTVSVEGASTEDTIRSAIEEAGFEIAGVVH